jgi:hypothetical protein
MRGVYRLLEGTAKPAMTTVLIDLRCLQSGAPPPGARPAIAAASRHGARLIGLCDPRLPALRPADAALVDEIRDNAYAPDAGAAVFLNPAPANNPLFVARLLLRPEIYKIALNPPAPAPAPATPAQTLARAHAAAWAGHYDALLPPGADLAAILAARPAGRPGFGIGGARPRIAMLTPLPPAKSGVADYSAQTARALEPHADVTLFTPARASATAHLARRFDRVVSVLGNSAHHSRIYDLHASYGGAVICHDSRLMHFFNEKFGPARTAAMAAAELGRPVSQDELALWLADESTRAAMCLADLPRSALPFICHAPAMAAQVGARYPRPAAYLPFAIYRPWAAAELDPARQQAARARLGFGPAEKLIVTLGFANASKAIAETAAAMEQLRGRARLVWVGEADGPLPGSPDITFLNRFTTEASYRDHLLAADAALQLRIGGTGNISGALQDCIAAGLPTVANADLAEALGAPSYVIRVADRLDPREIAAALAAILDSKPATGAERAAYAAERSMENYAAGLCALLELDASA